MIGTLAALALASGTPGQVARWAMPPEIYAAIDKAGESPDLATLRALLARIDAEAERCERIETDQAVCEEAFNLSAALSGEALLDAEQVGARYERAIAVAEAKHGFIAETPLHLHRTYGLYLARIGRAQAAEDRLRLVVERSAGLDAMTEMSALGHLAVLMLGLGRLDEAEAYLAPVLAFIADGEWRQNPFAISVRSTEAALAAARGDHDEAASLYADTCVAMYRTMGETWGVATCSLAWGQSLIEIGDLERAEGVLRIATDAHDKLMGPEHVNSLLARAQAARVLSLRGKEAEADELFARNRALLASAPQSFPAELRTLLYRLDAAPLVREQRALPLARSLLMAAQQAALEAMAMTGAADALARRSLESARPAFLLRVEASWRLANR